MTSFLANFGSLRSSHDVGAGHLFSSNTFFAYMMPVPTMPSPTALFDENFITS